MSCSSSASANARCPNRPAPSLRGTNLRAFGRQRKSHLTQRVSPRNRIIDDVAERPGDPIARLTLSPACRGGGPTRPNARCSLLLSLRFPAFGCGQPWPLIRWPPPADTCLEPVLLKSGETVRQRRQGRFSRGVIGAIASHCCPERALWSKYSRIRQASGLARTGPQQAAERALLAASLADKARASKAQSD
jgi:hypothetical protein